jgi:hypothetical protein
MVCQNVTVQNYPFKPPDFVYLRIFGSPKDLCQHSYPENPNFVRAWWSDDLKKWHTTPEPTLRLTEFPLNTDVTPVHNFSSSPGSSLPNGTLNFLMIMDKGRVAFHNNSDRNMSQNWHMLDGEADHGIGACPSVHYAEEGEIETNFRSCLQ